MENNILKRKISTVFFPLLALIAVIFAGYFYVQLHTLQQNPQITSQKEIDTLMAKISALIVLPTGETPTIATVSDPEALKDQSFFTNAQKGDKISEFLI